MTASYKDYGYESAELGWALAVPVEEHAGEGKGGLSKDYMLIIGLNVLKFGNVNF